MSQNWVFFKVRNRVIHAHTQKALYKFDKKCQKIKRRKLPELPYKASKIIEFYYTNPSISVRPTNTNDFQSACKGTKKGQNFKI